MNEEPVWFPYCLLARLLKLFLLQNRPDLAHSDQPLREGSIHISAPHIYGCIVEALDIPPSSSLSFLNIGSGTGYISSVVAHIIGPTGVCYGVENNRDTLDHCLAAVDRFKTSAPNEVVKALSFMEFIHGNGLEIDASSGESLVGFDRIYVGAAVEKLGLNQLASLLRKGGVLVAPGKWSRNLMQCLSHKHQVPKAARSV
jgi:protein-L-isoaspartate O-methyltransferase